jgi:hypothetical protein
MNAVTVAGNGASGAIVLNGPTGIVLDADGYLFIVDTNNHRIVGSGPDGFRCVVGCSGGNGSASYRLSHPAMMGFDRDGNIFVVDRSNNRIQRFLLSSNSYSESSTTTTTSTSMIITSQASIVNQCKHRLGYSEYSSSFISFSWSFSVFCSTGDFDSEYIESFFSHSISTKSRFLSHCRGRTELQQISLDTVPMDDQQRSNIDHQHNK